MDKNKKRLPIGFRVLEITCFLAYIGLLGWLLGSVYQYSGIAYVVGFFAIGLPVNLYFIPRIKYFMESKI
jgi:hypothetical protein